MENESESIKETKRYLASLIKRYEEGDPRALLDALRLFCVSSYLTDFPDKISGPIVEAIDRWSDLKVKTLDEAFSVAKPKGFSFKSRRTKKEIQMKVFLEVVNHYKKGASIGPALFEEVGEIFKISSSQVNKLYDKQRNYILDSLAGDPDLLKKVKDYLRLREQ